MRVFRHARDPGCFRPDGARRISELPFLTRRLHTLRRDQALRCAASFSLVSKNASFVEFT